VSALVIDASIAIKWVIDEEGTKEALALRGRALAAPDLLIEHPLEKGPSLRTFRTRGGIRGRSSCARRHRSRGDAPLPRNAVRIATALDHPAYDCMYIALAEAQGLPFVTADASLLYKVKQQATGSYAGRVFGLGDAPV